MSQVIEIRIAVAHPLLDDRDDHVEIEESNHRIFCRAMTAFPSSQPWRVGNQYSDSVHRLDAQVG